MRRIVYNWRWDYPSPSHDFYKSNPAQVRQESAKVILSMRWIKFPTSLYFLAYCCLFSGVSSESTYWWWWGRKRIQVDSAVVHFTPLLFWTFLLMWKFRTNSDAHLDVLMGIPSQIYSRTPVQFKDTSHISKILIPKSNGVLNITEVSRDVVMIIYQAGSFEYGRHNCLKGIPGPMYEHCSSHGKGMFITDRDIKAYKCLTMVLNDMVIHNPNALMLTVSLRLTIAANSATQVYCVQLGIHCDGWKLSECATIAFIKGLSASTFLILLICAVMIYIAECEQPHVSSLGFTVTCFNPCRFLIAHEKVEKLHRSIVGKDKTAVERGVCLSAYQTRGKEDTKHLYLAGMSTRRYPWFPFKGRATIIYAHYIRLANSQLMAGLGVGVLTGLKMGLLNLAAKCLRRTIHIVKVLLWVDYWKSKFSCFIWSCSVQGVWRLS